MTDWTDGLEKMFGDGGNEYTSNNIPRIAAKIIADGKVVFEQKGLDNIVFLNIRDAQQDMPDGEPAAMETIVVAGNGDVIHRMAVSFLKALNERGELIPALLCLVTGAHDGPGEGGAMHNVQTTQRNGIMDQNAMAEMIRGLRNASKNRKKS